MQQLKPLFHINFLSKQNDTQIMPTTPTSSLHAITVNMVDHVRVGGSGRDQMDETVVHVFVSNVVARFSMFETIIED